MWGYQLELRGIQPLCTRRCLVMAARRGYRFHGSRCSALPGGSKLAQCNWLWLQSFPAGLKASALCVRICSAVWNNTFWDLCAVIFRWFLAKFLLITMAKFLLVGFFWCILFACFHWAGMKTQKVLWDCEQIPTLMYGLCLDPGFWLKWLLQSHVGIFTYRVMFCFNQIKETEESIKCKCKSQSPHLTPNLMNSWTRAFSVAPFLDTGLGCRLSPDALCGEEQWSALWKDLSPGASQSLDLEMGAFSSA